MVNENKELVQWSRIKAGKLTALRVGTQAQPVLLGSAGDDHRINWGYVYAAASTKQAKSAIGANQSLLDGFVQNGSLPATDDAQMPRAVNDRTPVLAFVFDLGSVGAKTVERQAIVAYDEIYAIKYFGAKPASVLAAQRHGAGGIIAVRRAGLPRPARALRKI